MGEVGGCTVGWARQGRAGPGWCPDCRPRESVCLDAACCWRPPPPAKHRPPRRCRRPPGKRQPARRLAPLAGSEATRALLPPPPPRPDPAALPAAAAAAATHRVATWAPRASFISALSNAPRTVPTSHPHAACTPPAPHMLTRIIPALWAHHPPHMLTRAIPAAFGPTTHPTCRHAPSPPHLSPAPTPHAGTRHPRRNWARHPPHPRRSRRRHPPDDRELLECREQSGQARHDGVHLPRHRRLLRHTRVTQQPAEEDAEEKGRRRRRRRGCRYQPKLNRTKWKRARGRA